MFDMTTVSLGSNMSGTNVPMGSLTPSSGVKYSHTSPLSHNTSPMTPMSTAGSLSPHSTIMSNGKSVNNSNSKDQLHLLDDSNESTELFGAKCKRKINFSHLGIPKGHPPATVQRRNARERNRVKQVNNGFSALKQHIPLGHRSKKMSKVETLRCAVEYIKNLKGMLDLNGALLAVSNMSSSNSVPSSISSNESSDQNQNHFSVDGDFSGVDAETLAHLGHHQHFGSSTTTIPAGSHQLSPTSSEDPSSPSYASEASYITSSNNNNNNNNNNATRMYDYENYEPVSPEDDAEFLIDTIAWWQQS